MVLEQCLYARCAKKDPNVVNKENTENASKINKNRERTSYAKFVS